jgi:LDH2 family malate/lactate/ureidoglycolate dehydrogenase
LRATGALILEAAGAGPEEARAVADSLVGSDVRGVHSHGVVRIPDYVRAMKEGRITAGARTLVTADVGGVVALDGQRGFGQVAARTLAETAAGRARLHGISLALLTNVSHVGRLGEWVEQVADEGLVALAWCNCGDPGGNVVPFGGRESRLGTNPMAYAVPAAGRRPVVADFSTSIVAEGKVRVFLHEGRELPLGWILDAEGNPTTDPAELYRGGAILPMGGHKGFALALLVEVLGGILAGAGCASLNESPGNGLVLVVVDPRSTRAGADFGLRVSAVLEAICSSPPAAGQSGPVVPGDPENAVLETRSRKPFALPAETWQLLERTGESLGLDIRPEPPTEGEDDVL